MCKKFLIVNELHFLMFYEYEKKFTTTGRPAVLYANGSVKIFEYERCGLLPDLGNANNDCEDKYFFIGWMRPQPNAKIYCEIQIFIIKNSKQSWNML